VIFEVAGKPKTIGDEITARVTVKAIREDKPIMKLETICLNQRGEIVIRGEATVLNHG